MSEHVPQDVLLAFMRGELDEAEEAELRRCLQQDTALRTELRWLQLAACEAFVAAKESTDEFAFYQLQQRIAEAQAHASPRPTRWQQLRLWMQSHSGTLQGALASLVLVQAVALSSLWWGQKTSPPASGYRGSGDQCLTVSVRFNTSARGVEITRWLNQYGASIVEGPDAEGRYKVRLADIQTVGDFMYSPETRTLTDAISQPAGCGAQR